MAMNFYNLNSVAELEAKIEELKFFREGRRASIPDEIKRLQSKGGADQPFLQT